MRYLNETEAADYLGLNIDYLRRQVYRGIVAYYRPSARVTMFDPKDLDAWRDTWHRTPVNKQPQTVVAE
jgi:ligand-binding sensor domain-containing protein